MRKKIKRQIIFELKRKAIHFTLGIIIAFLIYRNWFLPPMWISILVLGIIAAHLLKTGGKLPLIGGFVISFEREKELKKHPLRGALFFLAGCILSYFIFDQMVAVFAVLTLVIGDTVAALYGIVFGKIKSPTNSQKHIDAALAGILANTFFASIFLQFEFSHIFLASLVAILAESLIPFDRVEKGVLGFIFDDNLLIPLVAGLVLFFINYL